MNNRGSRRLYRYLAWLAAYLFVGYVGFAFCLDEGPSSSVWLPAGIALAGILLGGYRLWPVFALGSAILATSDGMPLAGAALVSLGSTSAALVGAWMLKRSTNFDLRLLRMRNALALVVLGGAIPSLVSASLGTLAWLLTDSIEPSRLGTSWAMCWIGSTAGVLVVTPLVLIWAADWRSRSSGGRHLEIAAVLLALGLASAISFSGLLELRPHLPLAFLPFPFLLWAAFRLSMRWVPAATLIVVTAALWGTASGTGPFARLGLEESTAVLWLFIALVALTMLLAGTAMAERRRGESRWIHAVESNPNAMALVDREGRIVLVNSQLEHIFGYARSELAGREIELLVPPRFRTAHTHLRSGFAGQPSLVPMGSGRALYGQRKDGTEFPVEVGLASIDTEEGTLIITAISDITSRKRAELALEEERNFVSAILGTVGALVVVTDVDGRIVRFNAACEETTGYTSGEVEGLSIAELFLLPEEAERTNAVVEELRSGATPGPLESHWRTKSAGLRLIRWASTVLRNTDGSVRFIVGTGIDITDQRRAEEQSLKHQAALAHVDRLAAAGELAASLAHELNQPLSAITSYCDTALAVVQAQTDDRGDVAYALNQACEQSERASAIIRHLRDFVRKENAERRPESVNEVIKDATRFVETEARHGDVAVQLDLGEDLPLVMADRIQIEQVLVNLLRNSFQAMALACSPERKVIIRSHCPDGATVQITVQDTGPGFAAGIQEHLFDIFATTNPEGLGLGLSISRSIVEAHGGQLWAEPDCAEGAGFSFSLPAEEAVGASIGDRICS